MKPDVTKFLVLGAAKAGTTSLCKWVGQHNDVYIAPVKEPIFFEAEYDRGIEYYWSTYYPTHSSERAVGEGRTYNLYLPFVPQRIADAIPDARLIALLRDPVQRAYSHWWHRYTRGQERMGFVDAIAADLRRIEAGDLFEGVEGANCWRRGLASGTRSTRWTTYVEMGYYARQIERYREYFPAEQIRVYFQEDMAHDPLALVRDFWLFIGVESDFHLDNKRPHNVARTFQRGRAEYIAAQVGRMVRADRFVPRILYSVLTSVFRKRPVTRPVLSEDVQKELEAHFLPHDQALQRLLGRPVSYLTARSLDPGRCHAATRLRSLPKES